MHTKNFLGKKRLKSPPEDLINKENNEEIKINQEKNVINNNTIEISMDYIELTNTPKSKY